MLPISYGPLTFNGGGTAGGLKFKGSVAFEELPTTGQEVGDMYNITNDFVLGGKHYVAGTNVAWTGTEWDALGGDTASLFITASSHTTVEGYEVPVLTDTQIINAYNGVNAGKNVFIVDDLDTLTMQVLEVSSIDSPDVSISLLFTDTLILTYLTGGEIEAKVLGDSDWDNITNKPFEDLGEGISANTANELVSNFITGNYGKPKALSSVDLNTITNTGVYSCDSCTNRPNNSNGVMLVIKNAGTSDNLVQVYWTFQNDIMYVRHKDLGNWKEWKKISNLSASDIYANNLQTIQQNLERIDERIDNTTTQFESMPTASADYLDKVIQYTGDTTSSFTNGHFYKCVSDGATTPTYSWQEIAFGGSIDAVYITNTNYNTPEIISAVDEAYQKYLNDEPYFIYSQYFSQEGSTFKKWLPVYFINRTSNIWQLNSPMIFMDQPNDSIRLIYNVRLSITITNDHVTNIYSPQRYKVGITEGSATSQNSIALNIENRKPYQPANDFEPAHKSYVDASIYKNLDIHEWTSNTSYNVGDLIIAPSHYIFPNDYGKTLMECTTAHTSGTSFNSTEKANWTTTISASNLKKIISASQDYVDKTHYENISGYDATKTQVLKNVNGTLTWVDES